MVKIITKTYRIEPGADLRRADLSDVNLERTDLTKADLRGAYCIGTSFYETDLKDAYLEGMIIDDGEGKEYVLGKREDDIRKMSQKYRTYIKGLLKIMISLERKILRLEVQIPVEEDPFIDEFLRKKLKG